MVIVKMMGGLGNQMFQYATARRVAFINNADLKLDTNLFSNHDSKSTPRKFILGNFNIVGNVATKKEIECFKKYKRNHIKIFGWFYNRLIADDSIYISEHGYGLNRKVLSLTDNVYLDGWWNTPKYFEDIGHIIRQEFTLRDMQSKEYENIRKEISFCKAVSIHVRRGDYVTNPELTKNYGTCDLNYYNQSIVHIAKKIKNPHFYIFSDDIEWVKKNLKIEHPHTFVSNESIKDYEELMLMAKCKHNIIANSTFSWWGAWLNHNKEKIVVAPKVWFKDTSFIPTDLVPKSWVRI